MPPLLGPDAYQRPATVVEIAHDVVLVLRHEAARRGLSVPGLVREILDVVATDHLVGAILDDGGDDSLHTPAPT